jgi:leucyl-tRNA synthetase
MKMMYNISMKVRYNPQDFENKWNKNWQETHVYKTSSDSTNKSYVLVMFPYPSGSGLHVGHARVYTGADVIARFMRMKHGNVLYPMGWDAFGLPAENAAIKAKKNPMDMVPDNISHFKSQMENLGLAYDWNKELATTDPNYYKWTQWLFIKFFEMGLLYKQNTLVYFCDFCKTGLAEEEVLANGTHERCGNVITRKELPQWIFKITAFADRLLNDLEGLDWPEGILAMQRKWIGRKEGMEIQFEIENQDLISVWTSRPETIYGVTFLVLAPEHTMIQAMVKKGISPAVSEYVKTALSKTDEERLKDQKEKTGVFTGMYAIHPLTHQKLPIWVSDYVLSDVGSGAVMSVPAHDSRDKEFAKKFNLPSVSVIDGDKIINSDILNNLTLEDARRKLKSEAEKKLWGKSKTRYHLRDWIFSRQRYWGEPIPMVHCKACEQAGIAYFDNNSEFGKYLSPKDKKNMAGWFPLPETQLPLKLPYIKSYEPSADGSSPLSQIKDFVETTCPHCRGPATRETDTMPNWAGSCWYFLAFPWWERTKGNEVNRTEIGNKSPSIESWPQDVINQWAPVDWYIGGAEHAVLHLLYARFWTKALQEMGILGFSEPFLRLRNVGMVGGEDGQKMSKSRGNVINPNDVIAEYGADALRVFEMFMAPYNQDIAWSTKAMQGSYRFLTRIWQIYISGDNITDDTNAEDKDLLIELQSTVSKITSDLTDVKFNTSIAAMMSFLNKWESKIHDELDSACLPAGRSRRSLSSVPPNSSVKNSAGGAESTGVRSRIDSSRKLSIKNAKKFLQLLAPFAPFMTEELWHKVFKENSSIHLSSWPIAEKIEEVRSIFKIPIQVNGKLRGLIETKNTEKNLVLEEALNQENISKYLMGQKYDIKYIEGKVLNFIIKNQ